MKATSRPQTVSIDNELMAVFKETFGNDQGLLNEAIAEAERALSYLQENHEWHEMAGNGEYELF